MLQVKNLSKQYKNSDVYSLKNVSFSIKKGEIVGLIGKNGAGKTTLMKMIVKTLVPSSGSVFLNRKNIFKGDNLLRDVGILIDPAYYAQLSVMENLEFYLAVNQQTEYTKNIQPVLELVDLWKKKDHKPSSFSFGMKQRLSLAMCLVTEPELAVMDEPFVGLDPIGVADLIRTLKAWAKEKNMTILISSHQLAELKELCDRFIFIEQGRLAKKFGNSGEGGTALLIRLEKKLDPAELKEKFPALATDGDTLEVPHDSEELNAVLSYLTACSKIKSIEAKDSEQLKNYFTGGNK